MVAARSHRHPLTVVVTAFCLVGVVNHPAVAAPAVGATVGCDLAGSGTSADPYLVATVADLAEVGTDCAKDAEYLQTADITLPTPAAGQSNHTPIAPCPDPWNNPPATDYFSGVYDGNGKAITGLTVRDTTTDCMAMFGMVSGELRDVHLVDVVIEGEDWAAGLVGYVDGGTISGSSVAGTISGRDYTGGLIGRTSAAVTNSSASGTVAGRRRVGGLVGHSQGGTVTDSTSSSVVTGTSTYVGGLVGITTASISGSSATGAVTGTSSHVGGLVGSTTASISGSSATGAVSGNGSTGGLVGESSGAIADSHATGNVTSTGLSVGGLVGKTSSGNAITDSHATGDVTSAANNAGGLVGVAAGTITDSRSSGSVSGSVSVGGLVGYAVAAISGSSATGNVSGQSGVGGLVGNASADVLRSFATGNITGSSESGGLVGTLWFGRTISNSYATGDVTVTVTDGSTGAFVGGLVGTAYSPISDSFATGTVSAERDAGGLIGWLYRTTVDRSFASGTVTVATGTPGALVGKDDNGTIDAVSAGVTATALRDIDTFTGWAIVSEWEASAPSATPPKVWGICASTNDGHPYLLWQFTAATKPTSCDGTTTTSSSVPTSSTPSPSTPASSTPASSTPSSSTPSATTPTPGAPDTTGTTTTAATTTTSIATDPPPATPVATTTAPARRPGEVGAIVDGVESPVQMSTEGPVVLTVDGATVAIDGAGVAVVDSVVTLAVGGEVEVIGTGLPPGTTGEIVIMSEPRRLGTFAVAGDGTMSLRTIMPDDLAVGDHTIMVSVGTLQLTLGVTVTDTVADTSTVALPTTGWEGEHLMVALVITALGTFIVLTRRPRHTPSSR